MSIILLQSFRKHPNLREYECQLIFRVEKGKETYLAVELSTIENSNYHPIKNLISKEVELTKWRI